MAAGCLVEIEIVCLGQLNSRYQVRGAVLLTGFEPRPPLGHEPGAVDLGDVVQMQLGVGGRLALNVDDPGCRVDHHLPAPCPQLEAEVGVLVVRRLPFEPEAADLEKVRFPHHEAGRRAEIHRVGCVVVVRSPHGPLPHLDHVAGRQGQCSHLLDATVRIEEERTHCGNVRIAHGRAERLDPAGLHKGVVVEEDDVVAAGSVDADVVAFAEEAVLTHLKEDEVTLRMAQAQYGELLGGGAVVHQDDLPDQIAAGMGQRVETLDRRRRLVVVEDYDRDVAAEWIRRGDQCGVRLVLGLRRRLGLPGEQP